jgi:crotonobetainyl-CoA:carnitine CoA-transferase CaiB-like acyl-CoA transferase
VYRCAGDDEWIAIAVADDAQWSALVDHLGSPAWAADGALAREAGRRAAHDELDARLGEWCAARDARVTVEGLVAAGVPAGVVIAPRDVARNPQLRDRGLFEVEDHPVTGPIELPTVPLRLSGVRRWLRWPSPTLGQHNDAVLGEVATGAELASLRAQGVVGERPAGL